MSDNLLENVKNLLSLGVGDSGRLEHIRNTLEKNKPLYSSDKNYVDKLVESYLTKPQEDSKFQSKLQNNELEDATSNNHYCYNCGKTLIKQSKYCSNCGNQISPNMQNTTSQPQSNLVKSEVTPTRSQKIASKFSIVIGIIVLLGGIVLENYFYSLIGIVMFVTGFVGLKNKSKTIDQFLTVISFVLLLVIIIHWVGSY